MASTLEYTFLWFGLVFPPSNDDLWLTSPRWEEEWGWRALIWFGLVWYFLQAMATSDLPLLGAKKSREGWQPLTWFGLVFPPSNDDLWFTSPRWEEGQGWRALWSTLFIGLVWFALQAMTTSGLPLLGENKSGDGEHWFGLVWFAYKQWQPLTYSSSARRRAGMASIDLFWFGISSKQWRPLTSLLSARRKAGMATIDLTSNIYVLSKQGRDGKRYM